MKLIITLYLFILLISGCNQPIAKSLLTSESIENIDTDSTSVDDGALDIQADNPTMTMNMDDADKIEISGTCKDLDRKKNRILVEVFAGEDETVDPYISNSLSSLCLNTSSGVATTNKCFWVTSGLGLVESSTPTDEIIFPQCHNGRFSFSVKLGKILVNTGNPNFKYTVRFKLRTLEGILSDTVWSRVSVNRGLAIPVIELPVFSATATSIQCNIKTLPARYNHNISYELTRTPQNITTLAEDVVGLTRTLYTGQTTLSVIDGASVFSWNDIASTAPNYLMDGVTYYYRLISKENQYAADYVTPATVISTSAPATCTTPTLNAKISVTAGLGFCYLDISNPRHVLNPANVHYEWGYSTVQNWTGPNLNANNTPTSHTVSACGDVAVCTQPGLVSGATYYFAVREYGDSTIGKWSNTVTCRP